MRTYKLTKANGNYELLQERKTIPEDMSMEDNLRFNKHGRKYRTLKSLLSRVSQTMESTDFIVFDKYSINKDEQAEVVKCLISRLGL